MKWFAWLLVLLAGLAGWLIYGVPVRLPEEQRVPLGKDLQQRLSTNPDAVLALLEQADDPRQKSLRDLQLAALRARKGQPSAGLYAGVQEQLGSDLSPLAASQLKFLQNQALLWGDDIQAKGEAVTPQLEGPPLPAQWVYLLGPDKPLPIKDAADFQAACALLNQQVLELNGRAEVVVAELPDTPVGAYVRRQLELRRSWQGPDFYTKAAAYFRPRAGSMAWRYLQRSQRSQMSMEERLEWMGRFEVDEPAMFAQRVEAQLVGTAPAAHQPLLRAYVAAVQGDHTRATQLLARTGAQQRATPAGHRLALRLAAAEGRWEDAVATCERLKGACSPSDQLKWAVALEQLGRGSEALGHYPAALKDPALDPGRRILIENRLAGGPLATLVYWVEWKQGWRVVVAGEGVPHEVLPLLPLWRHVDAPWKIRSSPNVKVVEAEPYFTREDTHAALFKVTFANPASEGHKYAWWLEATSPPAKANYPGRFCNRTKYIFNDHAAIVLDAEGAANPEVTALSDEGAWVRTRAGSLVCDFYRFRFDPPWTRLLLDAPMRTVSASSSPSPEAILAAFRPRRQGRYEEE